MLTFILNVLGEVLGIYIYSAGSGPCARQKIDLWRDQGTFKTIFQMSPYREILTSSSAAIRGTDSYSTSGRRAQGQL